MLWEWQTNCPFFCFSVFFLRALNEFTLYAKLAGSAFDMDVRVWSFTLQHCYHRPYNHSTLSCAEDGKDKSNDEAPENNLQYTTVYVGNLAPEARILLSYS